MADSKPIAYLASLDPALLQAVYPIAPEGVVIGRDVETCQIIAPREHVSRRHCSIVANGSGLILIDHGSTNGTYVDGQRVKDRCALTDGAQIGLGRPEAQQFRFSRTKPPATRRFRVTRQPVYQIGRELDNDIPFANDPTVSAHHARLRIQGDADLAIEDLGSSNGTFLNNEPVTRLTRVAASDRIRIGSVECSVALTPDGLEIQQRDWRNQLLLQTRDLTRTERRHTILRDINLVIEPGEFVGLLGPSGAGKSTLLKALCGYQPANDGKVLVNGISLYDNYDLFRNSIGYVPQDDIIHANLSVERALAYTARMRLPNDSGPEQIGMLVNGVIKTLGLSHVRANRVSSLSGGQRKRVSIGCELLTRPSFLFLDEPTSGLDPSTEEKLMRHFGRLAAHGQSIVITTHILYNLDCLDLVAILARGRLLYFGPVAELCGFFSTGERAVTRPIEIFDVLEPEASDSKSLEEIAGNFERKYRNSELYEKYVVRRSSPVSPVPTANDAAHHRKSGPSLRDLVRHLRIQTMRVFDLKFSALAQFAVPLGAPLILALLTATIDVGSAADREAQAGLFASETVLAQRGGMSALAIPLSLPFMITMTSVFLGTLLASLEVSGERPIYLRERLINLKIPVYLASKLPFLAVMGAVQAFVYVSLTCGLLGLLNDGGLNALWISILLIWASSLVGLCVSALDPTPGNNSVIMAVVATLPQMLLSGAMAPKFFNGLNAGLQVVAAALPARWGFEMMLTAFYREPAGAAAFISGTEAGHMGFRFGSEVYFSNSLALGAVGLGFFLTACAVLKRYDRL